MAAVRFWSSAVLYQAVAAPARSFRWARVSGCALVAVRAYRPGLR